MRMPRKAGVIALTLTVSLATTAALAESTQPRGPYPPFAPCTIFPPSTLAPGSPAAADQTAWNQDISQAPLDPNSADYIAYINSHGGGMLHPDFGSPRAYGFPYSVVRGDQQAYRVRFTAYRSDSTRGRYRIPADALIEGGQRSDGDRHVISINRKECKLQELYRAFFRDEAPRWEAESGVKWDLRSAALRTPGYTSADAAGLPIFPGLVRYDEATGGGINHAIRVTFADTRDAWINPASHCASDITNPDAPPMGLRLRLSSAYDISGLTGPAQTIAVALKRYGFLVADNGSNWFFSGTSDKRWDDENLNQLKTIPGSAFQVVQSAAPVEPC